MREKAKGRPAPDALEYDPGPHNPHVAALEAPDIAVKHMIRAWQGHKQHKMPDASGWSVQTLAACINTGWVYHT